MICYLSAEREREFDRDRDRERDSIFRIRERTRWLDSALREDSSVGRLDHDRTDAVLGFDTKKQSGSQSALSFGEELQYWIDKVFFVNTVTVVMFHFRWFLFSYIRKHRIPTDPESQEKSGNFVGGWEK